MKKIIVSLILVCCPSFMSAMDKQETKKKTLINLGDNSKNSEFRKTNKSIPQQMKERYNLDSDSNSDGEEFSVKIDIDKKDKKTNDNKPNRSGFEIDEVQKFLSLTDLSKQDPKTGALLDVMGMLMKKTDDKYQKTKTKLADTNSQIGEIKKNQESRVRDYVHEGSNFSQNVAQFIGIVITIVIVQVINNYTKTA